MDIYKIIDDRLCYSLASKTKNKDDLDYIDHVLSTQEDQAGLILSQNTIDRKGTNNKLIKELVLSDWYISGVFDLSQLMRPYSSINFSFYWLTKAKPKQVLFSIFKGLETFKSNKQPIKTLEDLVVNRVIAPKYEKYLSCLSAVVNNTNLLKINQHNCEAEFFNRELDDINFDNISIKYNSPEMVKNRLKLKNETTQPLSEVADILFPRQIKDKTGRVCKIKHFDNLQDSLESDVEKATDILIQAGDILVTRMGKLNITLVEHDFNEPVYASPYLIVIRPRSDMINPEFLFLYFKSDTAQNYFLQFEPSVIGRYFTKERISNLPIIIPNQNVLSNTKQLFEALYKNDNPDRIEIINKELFNCQIPEKPFQKDLIQEILNHLQIVKQHFIREIIKSDLSEIDACINAGAYKSALILSGSVLEGVLLDWLSEIDKVDYINSKTHKKMLGEIISELKRSQHLTTYLIDAAFKISGYRNIVHPKVFLQKRVDLDKAIAEEILSDLKKILSKRLRDNSEKPF